MVTSAGPRIAGRVAFAYPDFIRYELARFFIVLALEMQSVAVGWQVYDITKRPLDLGLIGLAQFLPGIVLFLPAGHAADRFDRRSLLTICYAGFALASGLLLATTWYNGRSVHAIYAIMVFLGIVRTFNWPVSRALLPQLIAAEHFPNAVAWTQAYFRVRRFSGRPPAGSYTRSFAAPQLCTQVLCWPHALQWSPRCKFIPSAGHRHGSQLSGTRCWPGSNMSGGRRLCWARFRWTCLQSYSAARWRCFLCTHAKFCTPDPGDSDCCAARLEWAPASWPFCLRIVRCADGWEPSCCGAWPDLGCSSLFSGFLAA